MSALNKALTALTDARLAHLRAGDVLRDASQTAIEAGAGFEQMRYANIAAYQTRLDELKAEMQQ